MFKINKKRLLVTYHENLRSILSPVTFLANAAIDPYVYQQNFEFLHTTTQEEESVSHIPNSLDPKYYISLLLRCSNIFQIRQVHAQLNFNGMIKDLYVANKLLFIYAHHKALTDAYALFNEMKTRDPVTWSVMIGGFAKAGDHLNCFKTFREVMRSGVKPDNYTLPFVIRTCRDTRDLSMGRVIHDIILKYGLQFDHFICAAIVDMYAKCRVIEDAQQLFEKMLNKDLVTWTVMIGAFAECNNAYESWVLFDQMREQGVVPDKVAIVTVVNASAKLGAMHRARLIHDYICRNKFSLDVILGTAMIDMYAKCGSIESAREIFDMMKVKNVITWSAMIAAYGYHGRGKEALDLFPRMLSSGILPNRITFLSLLYACSHAGMVEEGLRFFKLMWDEYAVRSDVKHYTCVVDLLGRAGRLDEAFNLIKTMTIAKDEGLWGALLGACRTHGHIELAEKAAESLLQLEPRNPGHYVLLSNIYAKAGKWENVAKIRDQMTQRRLKKIPGWTWIEVGDKTYQFSVGDSTHPWSKKIYGKLGNLSKKLELAGFVPDTNFVLHDVEEEVKLGMLYTHSEKLATAFGLIATPEGTPIRITKNLRVCGDCHTFIKLVSAIEKRDITVRDANRFHHFKEGACSCGDYW
ncbi:Pentatricopeptide repeat [Quillaja saponaria]|uniref:Pentatricopeptide repeat n=1 Tax=Quillaja saponaria TaxID=32244 RepID=A0AAD7PYL3_QUISA|nr:Pentatricopeptide repeat [Quillaja saponaria]